MYCTELGRCERLVHAVEAAVCCMGVWRETWKWTSDRNTPTTSQAYLSYQTGFNVCKHFTNDDQWCWASLMAKMLCARGCAKLAFELIDQSDNFFVLDSGFHQCQCIWYYLWVVWAILSVFVLLTRGFRPKAWLMLLFKLNTFLATSSKRFSDKWWIFWAFLRRDRPQLNAKRPPLLRVGNWNDFELKPTADNCNSHELLS